MVAVTVNVDTQGVDTQALQEYLTFMAMQYIKDKEESSLREEESRQNFTHNPSFQFLHDEEDLYEDVI